MTSPGRRTFLGQLVTGAGAAWLGLPLQDLLAIHQHVRALPPDAPFVVLTLEEAKDVEAIAAELIPTDQTPGATEAKVVRFIDRLLQSDAEERAPYAPGLAMITERVRELFPGTHRFADLDGDGRRRVLTAVEDTPFFAQLRGHTIAGFLTDPKYGGNAGEVGWRVIGFTPSFAYQPPFGEYDAEPDRHED